MWKKIKGYENYSVNEQGQVRNDKRNKLLTNAVKSSGYVYVDLYNKGKRKRFYVHRLVAMTFIDNPLDKPTVDHIDANKKNNNLNNLRWATVLENNSSFFTGYVSQKKIKIISEEDGAGTITFNSVNDLSSFFNIDAKNFTAYLRRRNNTLNKAGVDYRIEYA